MITLDEGWYLDPKTGKSFKVELFRTSNGQLIYLIPPWVRSDPEKWKRLRPGPLESYEEETTGE